MGTKVKLRQKPISGNRQSLYLDFYPPIINQDTGEKTRREFLGLYLTDEILHETIKYNDDNGKEQRRIVGILDKKNKPKKASISVIDKNHNKEIFSIAEGIRRKREIEINRPEIYSGFEREQLKIRENGEKSFIEYFKALANKRKSSNYDNWISCLNYLNRFTNGKLKFREVNETFCNEFKEFLLTTQTNRSNQATLSQNSVFSYFNKFKAALKQAYKDDYFQTNLNAKIDSVKPQETRRNFLTLEELNALVKTECAIPVLKKAAIFSALTGLRFSDIQKLIWNEIEFINDKGYFLNFIQKKTKGVEWLPIPTQAVKMLGEAGEPKEKVFPGLVYSTWVNSQLIKWVAKAQITKDITFHCFRHTYATLQLTLGTDIYTVSKMLGHRELKTTQIYAKIVDQKKRDASDKIILDL